MYMLSSSLSEAIQNCIYSILGQLGFSEFLQVDSLMQAKLVLNNNWARYPLRSTLHGRLSDVHVCATSEGAMYDFLRAFSHLGLAHYFCPILVELVMMAWATKRTEPLLSEEKIIQVFFFWFMPLLLICLFDRCFIE